MITMNLSTVILSLTPTCNLACAYCQNEPAFDNVPKETMSEDIIEIVVNSINEMAKNSSERDNTVTFCYAGGEPLLVGIEYFTNVLKKQEKISNKCNVRNVIQTNGTLINEDWADFFKKNNISVSISIDGPEFIHNNQRFFRKSNGSCVEAVVKGISHLRIKKINYGTLSVVTSNSIDYASEILDFIGELEPNMMGFLPCVDRGPKISAKQYGKFMSKLFDAWLEKNDPKLLVREFVHIIQGMLNIPHTKGCQFAGVCPQHINISPTGTVSVCDQYLEKPEGFLGNILRNDISSILDGEKFYNFKEKTVKIPSQCNDCRYLPLCNGGCAYRRNNFTTVDYLCEGRKSLFSHIENKLDKKIATMVNHANNVGALSVN
jgi:uncharacterized protein